MLRLSRIVTVLCFITAVALSYTAALYGARWIERSSIALVDKALQDNNLGWAHAQADGLQLIVTGKAPNEASRFRAITVAGSVVDTRRVIDAVDVVDTSAIAPPQFSLEILRNDTGISLIGLVPTLTGKEALVEDIERIAGELPVTEMLDTASHDIPGTWQAAVRYAIDALTDLPRSKISVSSDRIEVTGIVDSLAEKRSLEAGLTRRKPNNVNLILNISAPRPVITPYVLRITKSQTDGMKFDACTTDTEQSHRLILETARRAGIEGKIDCVIGLGVPTSTWSQAARAGMRALGALPGGSFTMSDADISLIAVSETTQENFDQIVAELKNILPDVFSLKATLTPPPVTRDQNVIEVAEFTATLSPEGILQMRGRLQDNDQENIVLSFARAYFGINGTFISTQALEDLPSNWTTRVFAAIEGLSYLDNGSILVESDSVTVRGLTGRKTASSDVTRVLSEKLGQSAQYVVEVRYDETLDPLANRPTPEDCVIWLNAILAEKKISFDPGEATFEAESLQQIGRLSDILEICDFITIEIGGHTDSQGREEMNKRLSQERANAVRNALIDRGVRPSLLTAVGYGEIQPIADNDTEEGREQNRRIAFTLQNGSIQQAETWPDLNQTVDPTNPNEDAVTGHSEPEEDETRE